MGYKPVAPEVTSEPNVVPMADIMLVLLIIFMVVTPMLQKGHSVDMALTQNPQEMKDADKEDAILLAVTRDGKIFLGPQQIALEQVVEEVRDLWDTSTTKTVYIKSDRRAKFGDVSKLVDEVRSIGVDQLGLLTERVEGTRPKRPSLPIPESPAGL